MSSVIVDNEVGGYLALEHLHSLGHRKIAFIRGPKTLATVLRVGAAFATAPRHAAWNSMLASLWTCPSHAIRFPVLRWGRN
jgi:DNA-binding LacI/PurR family transcriptional regulator